MRLSFITHKTLWGKIDLVPYELIFPNFIEINPRWIKSIFFTLPYSSLKFLLTEVFFCEGTFT